MISNDDRSLIEYLMGKNAFSDDAKAGTYAYITNPDGTIRWIYPAELKKPYFLNFYSTASFRAKVLSMLIRVAFFTKQSHRVKSGELKLNIAKESRLGKVLVQYPYTGFSIFTGTVGENRKAIIELHNDKELFMFVKIALSEAAKTLVNNEAKCLKQLSTFKFNTLVVPKLLSSNDQDTIGISNIKPKSFQQHTQLTKLHLNALSEVYEKENTQVTWGRLTALKESKASAMLLLNNFEVVNDLDKSRVHDLARKILQLVAMLEEEKDESLTVALSHGDFTPWNMYSTKERLHLFDWELSQANMPLMYDLFHFIFQAEIMIERESYAGIVNVLATFKQMQTTQNIITTYNVDFDKNYIFYLLHNTAYYLNKYIKQPVLHKQVFWLLDIWEEAIEEIIEKRGIIIDEK